MSGSGADSDFLAGGVAAPAGSDSVETSGLRPAATALPAPVLAGPVMDVPDVTVHASFEQQVDATSDAVALICGDAQLSYAELDARANRLAHALIARGVAPGARVGLLHSRRVELVVAVLGILKAGAAYVPLDPSTPDARLQQVLADAGLAALVTEAALLPRFGTHALPTLCTDADASALAAQPRHRPGPFGDGKSELYVIYTSGSTGTPKGAVVRQDGAVNLYRWFNAEFGHGAHTRFVVLSSIGHDITQKGLFGPLLAGGATVLLETQHYDAGVILDTIERHGVTGISCVPTALYGLLDAGTDTTWRQLQSLTHVFPGGEGLHPQRLRAWQRNPRNRCRVVNTYGPTETTDLTTFHPVAEAELDGEGILPLGTPIANTRLYLLDAALQPVPVGEVGELCIAGVLVGGGYVGRAELNAEKFVEHPSIAGERLYRSGDLVRFGDDGLLHHHGRLDQQVKVRGHRVELAEIEAALARHPGVVQAVVAAHTPTDGGETELAAYLRLADGTTLDRAALRATAAERLPAHLLPTSVTVLERFPLNASNKVDRNALPPPSRERPALAAAFEPSTTALEQRLAALWAELLSVAPIGTNDPFFELGGSSLKAIQFIGRLGSALGARPPIAAFFAAPTVAGFAQWLHAQHPQAVAAWLSGAAADRPDADDANAHPFNTGSTTAPLTMSRSPTRTLADATASLRPPAAEPVADDIAIVGLALRVPGADDAQAFWQNLVDGTDSLRELGDDELIAAGVPREVFSQPGYVRRAGTVAGSDCFDHAFFGLSPREAALTDPQQRLLLECAWHALEDAAIRTDDGTASTQKIGVFAGVARNSYFMRNLASHPELRENTLDFHTILGSDKDYAATRIAFKLDLRGPALSVQTACSSSGVALHLAAQSLRTGECDAALAGGASVPVPAAGYAPVEGGPLAQDGVVRAFDAAASGMVLTAGVACVVLKRRADAEAAGDRIYALLKGSAIGNDGAAKAAYTAPSVDGQAAVATAALKAAHVPAASVGYVEAHGTGTLLGDPIEVAALSAAYGANGTSRQSIALGSVKPNIGHLDAAAAVAGVAKVALALHHGRLPASLHCAVPNPECGFETGPFRVVTATRDWPRGGAPRRAGIASAGFGGTNFHAVLEQASKPVSQPYSSPLSGRPHRPPLLRLSAKTDAALTALAGAHAELLASTLADAAYTLDTGRNRLPRRGFLLGTAVSADDAAPGALAAPVLDPTALVTGSPLHPQPSLVFAFPGQGAQHPGMGRTLYEREPVFAAAVDECCDLLAPVLGLDLRAVLYPPAGNDAAAEDAAAKLRDTALAQPAIFTVAYATARLWQSVGIEPVAMVGHSVGEFVAATLAGVFALPDALALLAERGRLMQALPAGGMLAVRLDEATLLSRLPHGLALAAVNAPQLCVVSGARDALAALAAELQGEGIGSSVLHTSHAFHSPLMDAAVEPFAAAVAARSRQAPRVPFVSSLTGTWITDTEAQDPHHWARQLREPVRFAPAVEALLATAGRVFLEVGPGQNLTTSIRQTTKPAQLATAVASLPHAGQANADAATHFVDALGRLWLAGIEADPTKLYAGQSPQKISLPGYPFARVRHWIEPRVETARADGDVHATPLAAVAAVAAPEAPAASPAATTSPADATVAHAARVETHLADLLTQLTGLTLDADARSKTFLELGLDSLMLTQVAGKLKAAFKVEVKFRQLMEDLNRPSTLAAFLASRSPGTPGVTASAAKAQDVKPPESDSATQTSAIPGTPAKVFGAGTRISKAAGERDALTDAQRTSLDGLIERTLARTGKSKAYAQQHRAVLADPRTVSGFRPLLKEITYPIVTPRSDGAYLWDLDGNEYVDITNGFGCVFFGHRPKFVEEAVAAQLKAGWEIGPQTPLAGEVAEYVKRFTGLPRVAFCATGSEAVLAAMRTARTVTGRNLVVMHHGDYHGVFDEVIVRGTPSLRSVPAGAGIPPESVANTLILDYSSEKTLDVLKARGDEIAAVIVEPVQSRRPDWQPREYLHEVRRITEACGAAFVMDEVVTGFRAARGGAQEYFGVKADLGCYGKVIGGGLPIGVVAGIPQYMDALDGGHWQFGDDSVPEVGVTYFAGTFVRHPLAMAAALAVCKHLDANPQLQLATARRTQVMVDAINTDLAKAGAPLHLAQFTSLFKPEYTTDQPHGDLLYAFLREAGVHVWDARPCFLTTAHTDADCERVIEAFRYAVSRMQEGGWFVGAYQSRPISFEAWRSPYAAPLAGARVGRDAAGNPAWFVPAVDGGGATRWQAVEVR